MKRTITVAIITLACSVVNPLWLNAADKNETFRNLIDLLLNEGDDAEVYSGPLAQDLDLPNPASTRNLAAIAKWSAEAGREEEEVTDNSLHVCSVLVEKAADESLKPTKLIFKTRTESGRDSENYYFRSSLEGVLEKAEVTHAKMDENGNSISGSANNAWAFLDTDSPDVKARFQHELDLWLTGKYFKKKFRKKHLEDLAYYRNKRNPPPQRKKDSSRRIIKN